MPPTPSAARLRPRPRDFRACGAALALAYLSFATGAAQTQVPSPPSVDDPTRLPLFEVRDRRTGAYGAREATSTTRISQPIQDTAQTVSVVTRELIDDTQGLRMLDVAKFVTPVFEGTSRGGDRFVMRGFGSTTSLRFIDGVSVGAAAGNMSSNQTNIERLEIIKGPNAILVPGGAFGNIVNMITKSPRFANFTHLSLRARTYYGSEASIDAGRVLADRKTAVRLIATVWDGDGYAHGSFRRGRLLAPSFTHQFSPDTVLILKMETLHNLDSYGTDVTIDPAVGTKVGGYARKHPLLPRDNLWGPDERHRRETRLTSELRFKLANRIAARVWVMANEVLYDNRGAAAGAPVAGQQGSRNPLTGEWEPFQSFVYDAATRTVEVTTHAPSTDTRFIRRAGTDRLLIRELHFKSDYAVDYRVRAGVTGTTIAGFSANDFTNHWQQWSTERPTLDYATGRGIGSDEPLVSVLNRDEDIARRDIQGFVYQRVNAGGGRIILSGGIARFRGTLARVDERNFPALTGPRRNRVTSTDYNFGAIYKPVAAVSLFAGYNRVGGGLPGPLSAGENTSENFKVGFGDQRELGAKTTLFDQRLSLSASYYEIVQTNVSLLNSARNQDVTQPAYIFADLENRGWEVEFNALLTPQLEVIGNVTHLHMRDVFGARQRMVLDNVAALFARYTFREGLLKGLGLSIGADYTDRMAGDQPTLFTIAGALNQPSFYIAPRTLVQAGISYRSERWSAGIVVFNLTNKDYIQSSGRRTLVQPGDPRNVSATLEIRW